MKVEGGRWKGEAASLPSPDQPSVGARRGAGGEGRLNISDHSQSQSALTLALSQGERGPEIDTLAPRPSPFRLLLDPPASGAWNMAVDEVLLETAAAEGQCTLRFYQWAEPTLSLGYFQLYADRRPHEASSGCAVVRRASGGGAILHDIELTYSLALPSRHPLAVDRLGLYQAIHTILIEVLAQWGIEATMYEQPPSPPAPLPQAGEGRHIPQPFLCFQRRSPGDVLVGNTKIAGSAQRRCLGAVLQHGSVLLARSAAAPELDGLKELVGKTLTPEELAEAWLARLAEALPCTWQSGRLSDAACRRAAAIAAEKYASPTWTENRNRGY